MDARTKVGAKMNMKTKNELVDILSNPEHEGKTQKEIAALMNVTAKTVQNYLTAHVWQEIHERRLAVISESLTLVDRAVFAKAIKGDMVAAKLLYNRWDEAKKNEEFKSVHHIENEQQDLVEIERLQKDIQELEHDAGNST